MGTWFSCSSESLLLLPLRRARFRGRAAAAVTSGTKNGSDCLGRFLCRDDHCLEVGGKASGAETMRPGSSSVCAADVGERVAYGAW